MWRRGFAARWGGEEFLLVFENVDLAEARKQLDLLMDKIHELDTLYEGQHVKINMTFGLVCESDKDVHTLLKEADEKKKHVKADSMAAKANLVREFNEGKRQEK